MSSIIEAINAIDTNILLFLNGIHNSFFDQAAYIFSNKWTWIPLYLSILFVVIKEWKKDAVWIILALVISIVLADQIASGILKPLFKRLRPTHTETIQELVHTVNGYVGGKYGFVSSHAANSFALALLSSLVFKQKIYAYAIFTWAILNSYSRIYLGVHYPFDIIGGIAVGLFAGYFCFFLLKKMRPDIMKKKQKNTYSKEKHLIKKISEKLPVWVLIATVLGIIIYSAIKNT